MAGGGDAPALLVAGEQLSGSVGSTVLKVDADRPGAHDFADEVIDITRARSVAGLDIHRDRDVDAAGNGTGGVDEFAARDVLAIGVPACKRDGEAACPDGGC